VGAGRQPADMLSAGLPRPTGRRDQFGQRQRFRQHIAGSLQRQFRRPAATRVIGKAYWANWTSWSPWPRFRSPKQGCTVSKLASSAGSRVSTNNSAA